MEPYNIDMKQEINEGKEVKRRGTIKLCDSKGPPKGLFPPCASILTIGDGDLSFSLALSSWLKHISEESQESFRLVATTYDSVEELDALYTKAAMGSTLAGLKKNNVETHHCIDVNHLPEYQAQLFGERKDKFDRIVWNFPHAGFPPKNYGPGFEWQEQAHEKHKQIIKNFFKYSHQYLNEKGLAVMTHKTVQPFRLWDITKLAIAEGFQLQASHKFDVDDYPGYRNRRGAGKNGGKTFPVEDAMTYVFKPMKQ